MTTGTVALRSDGTVLAWGDDNSATPEEVADHFLKNYEAIWTQWVPEDVAAPPADAQVTAKLSANATELARRLAAHPSVVRVRTALTGPTADHYRAIMRLGAGAGSLVTVELREGAMRRAYDRLAVVKGPSFGLAFTIASPFLWLAHFEEVTNEQGRAHLRAAGLDPTVLDDPNARCPLSVTTRLWQLAVAASGDPALGLKTSQFVSPTTFHALGYALIASSSLREMFERIVRYHRVVSDALQLELRELEDVYEFRFRVPPGSPAPAPVTAIARAKGR